MTAGPPPKASSVNSAPHGWRATLLDCVQLQRGEEEESGKHYQGKAKDRISTRADLPKQASRIVAIRS
jgi:hypothetical protein